MIIKDAIDLTKDKKEFSFREFVNYIFDELYCNYGIIGVTAIVNIPIVSIFIISSKLSGIGSFATKETNTISNYLSAYIEATIFTTLLLKSGLMILGIEYDCHNCIQSESSHLYDNNLYNSNLYDNNICDTELNEFNQYFSINEYGYFENKCYN